MYEGGNIGSKIYLSVEVMDRCAMLSIREGIVRGRLSVDLGFGTNILFIGGNWKDPYNKEWEM